MNTALSWIKAYVPDLDVTAQEYTDAMTLTGTKVEGYERLDKNLEKIVVGQILKIERHPDADKLIICQVDVGNETIPVSYTHLLPCLRRNSSCHFCINKSWNNGIAGNILFSVFLCKSFCQSHNSCFGRRVIGLSYISV